MSESLVSLDLSALLRGDGPEAVGTRRVSTVVARLREIQERVAVPLPAGAAPLQEIADSMRKRADRLWVVGQPGALRAVAALGGPSLHLIGTPARTELPPAGSAVLLLEGPPWADRYAERCAEAGIPVAVASKEADVPPDGWWIPDPMPGDGRQGALGAGALVAAAFAGRPVAEVLAGAQEMAQRCLRTSFFENPGVSWGTCIAMAVRPSNPAVARTQFLHLVTEPALAVAADFSARSAMAILSEGPAAGTLRTPLAVSGRWGFCGDEEELSSLGTARDRMVTLWSRRGSTDAGMLEAVKAACAQAQQPAAILRLAGDGAEVWGAALYLCQHSVSVAAAWLGIDPSVSPAREAWRSLLEQRTAS